MTPEDSFIDDEDDTCPLCIEEFDLSDRNFKPCPCGYRICQFCFNNLKNNLNGLCPACRRPYDEKTIQYKIVTQEEVAEFRANIQKNQKKRAAEQRHKEAQKVQVDKGSRKNLVGVRVVQKNLVYVTGLTPTVPEDELLKTLRRQEFFGQYGNIQKISISNRKAPDGAPQSLGIYVTFERREDAARCIQAVNGSQNGDRVLKAQLGTTKYCSAWLRNEICGNRQCMFLHEQGDEEDSYTRKDLSSLNSIDTQTQRANAASSSRSASRQQASQQASAQTMVRTSSRDGSDSGDGPALPASANWARNPQQRSRRGSHATSGAAPSPAVSHALPVTAESPHEAVDSSAADDSASVSSRKTGKQPAVDAQNRTAAAPVKASVKDPFAAPDWNDVLKTLAACPASAFDAPNDNDESFPPLFDIYGGARRRPAREEDDNRLGEQEEPVDQREPSEGEPESGSLALGGEPEESRDPGRESSVFDQRRNPTQLPIQRTSTDNIFGGPLGSNYGQGSSAIGSIGGRTMTPQQPMFMRPQGSFVDSLPPGISTPQSGAIQGQGGHSRQQSRFSFNTENTSSSTNVKLAANPRFMAQQSSMMPSSYHTQPGSQFYASSMPGPPPGLKSTGTPPVSGSLYGQAHAFGGSGFNSSKDSEVLQNLFRGRGAGSGSAHDAGKREYFSSYPKPFSPSTSSTPAPASGPGLAMFLGSQPGAFQDFGSKQKKKGKKHRQANTSSSGGSGLVDLADPSILQARMQHQQGSNAGVGQGLFGGQTQDDDLLLMDEPSIDVDALVSDSYPDELEGRNLFGIDRAVTTPSVPPGLGFSQSSLPAQFGEMASIPTAPAPPGTPIARPVQVAVPRPVTPLRATPGAKGHAKVELSPGDSEAKESIKELAIKSGLSKDIAAQASGGTSGVASGSSKGKAGKPVLQDEDFPALDSKTATSTPKFTPVLPAKSSPKVTPALPSKASSSTPTKAAQGKKAAAATATETTAKVPPPKATARAEKRPVLDIAAATKISHKKVSDAATVQDKPTDAQAPNPSQPSKSVPSSALPASTPTSVSSPLARATPKTLRLVQTPKAELPPNIAPSATTAIRAAAAAAGHHPGTPASEAVSETASVLSASISASRSSSPPPSSKIGTAATRATTKSQQRKQRQKASKEASATIMAEVKPVEEEVEVAPVLGRKKKQKKDKKDKTNSIESPAVSRPETPVGHSTKAEPPVQQEVPSDKGTATDGKRGSGAKVQPVAEGATKAREQKSKEANSPPQSPVQVDTSIRLNESTKTTVLTPDYINPAGEPRQEGIDEGAVGEVPTLSEILQSLIEEGELPDPDEISLFRPLPNYRSEVERGGSAPPAFPPPNVKSVVTKEDEDELNAFRAVRKEINGHRVLLTPNGDFVLNLTEDEEEQFLQLQACVAEFNGLPTGFVAPKYTAGTGFSLIKGRAVPNGMPSIFPHGPGSLPPDPVGKMHREEAIGCINQHVLPTLNLSNYKPNIANGVSLQTLAPWMNIPESKQRQPRLTRNDLFDCPNAAARGADALYGNENWDDEDDEVEGPAPGAIGSTPLMTVEDAEAAYASAKKQHELTDKKLRQTMARIRRQFGLH